jgi:hypothetical protein
MLKDITPDQIDEIVTAYYKEQGWNAQTGVPTLDERGIAVELISV